MHGRLHLFAIKVDDNISLQEPSVLSRTGKHQRHDRPVGNVAGFDGEGRVRHEPEIILIGRAPSPRVQFRIEEAEALEHFLEISPPTWLGAEVESPKCPRVSAK